MGGAGGQKECRNGGGWWAGGLGTMVQLGVAVVVLLGVLGILPAVPVQAQTGTIYYVSTTGNDSNNGLTWGTAKRTLQAALAAASSGA